MHNIHASRRADEMDCRDCCPFDGDNVWDIRKKVAAPRKELAIDGIYRSMRLLVMTALVARAIASGAPDAGSDKSEIESLISEFNSATAVNDFDRLVALFAENGDYGVGGSIPIAAGTAIRQVAPKKLPWDERMPLAMKVQKIQFIRPGVVLADAIQSDSSPMTGDSRKWSCTFVFVSVGREWKIASYRESLIIARSR